MLWREKKKPECRSQWEGGFYRMKTRSDKEEEKAKRGTFTPGLSLWSLFKKQKTNKKIKMNQKS